MIRKKLENLKDKFTERANTLFTSMKDEEEKDLRAKIEKKIKGLGIIRDEDEGDESSFSNEDTKRKYDEEEHKKIKTRVLEDEKESRRADLLYPTMKDNEEKKEEKLDKINVRKEKETEQKIATKSQLEKDLPKEQKAKISKIDGQLTDSASDIKNMKYVDIKNLSKNDNDKNFFSALNIVFDSEGKYVNHKDDKGGPTNMGVTQNTYDDYCRRYKLPKKDVKNLSKNEAIKVYYNDYWAKSGLDREKDPIKSLILFDTAVLHGVGRAKEYNKKSKGNVREILELRREHYKNTVKKDPSQEKFFKGWNNRVDKLEKILNRYEGLE